MANSDVTLKNKDELDIYPITRERNVYDENNVNLKEKFKTVVFKDNEVHKFAQELYEESANIFNEKKFTNEYITYDGYTGDSATSILSHYIKVNPNTKYTFSSSNSSSMDRGYCFYDKTKKVIPGALWNSINKTVTTPSNAEYIRVSFPLGYTSMVNEGETALPYNPYNANRHITNGEAEFLKDEFGKSYNLAQVNSDNTAWNFNLKAKIENGKTYTVSMLCNKESSFHLKKNDNNGAILVTKFNHNGKYELTFIADWTGDLYINSMTGADYSEIMVNEGEPLPYQPYNSASHITNGQADLLKSEWERSANKINTNDVQTTTKNGVSLSVENNAIKLNGTATAQTDFTLSLSNKIPSGTYSINTFPSVYTPNVLFVFLNKSGTWLKAYGTNNNNSTGTQIYSEDITKIVIRVSSGQTVDLTINPMLIEGSTIPTTHYQYNGAIIHEKDIEPVLLWENGSPNAKYPATNQTILDSSAYKYLLIGYKDWYASTDGVKIGKYKNVVGNRFYLDYNEITETKAFIKSRKVTITSNTQLNFELGYSHEEVANTYDSNNDGHCTPIFVLGSNY